MGTKLDKKHTSAKAVVKGLNQLLADSYALMGITHHAHWNVEGPAFFALHTAFEGQYTELFVAVDVLAERVRALDAYAVGGLKELAEMSGIKEFSSGGQSEKDYVRGLLAGHEKTLKDARVVRDAAEKVGDLETQDLAIARIQAHEKTAWMLRSYLR